MIYASFPWFFSSVLKDGMFQLSAVEVGTFGVQGSR